jgi:tetratricopeptide (TPR) repeat protein
MSDIARRAARLPAIQSSRSALRSVVRFASLVTVLVALSSPSARGADDKDAKTAAKEHYQRGTSFYDLGRYPEAIKEFEAAYELKNDPAFLYNLAQSYRQAGDPEQALHFYRTYLRYVPKAPNRAEIEERIAALEKVVAEKGLANVQPPPEGGGGTTPTPVGNGEGTRPAPNPNLAPTGNGTVAILPPPPPPPNVAPTPIAPGTPPPPPVSSRARTFQKAGLYTAAGGGLLFVIGVIEGIRAKSASSDIESEAKNGTAYDPSVQSRGQSAEKAEAVFITLGVLAGATGAGLWYYGRRLAATESTTSYKISFAPVVSPSGTGAWLRVGF